MIKIDRTDIHGFKTAAMGARFPMNSNEKGDSDVVDGDGLGPNDFDLLLRLAKAGDDHGKALRDIHVSMAITAPLYWWKQMDTYSVGVNKNSRSTMHKIHAKEFRLEDFSTDRLYPQNIEIIRYVIGGLNGARNRYVQTKNPDDWYQMIQLLPDSYNQQRMWSGNYQVLRRIYNARKNHKLDEWHVFCDMLESLPYSRLITER